MHYTQDVHAEYRPTVLRCDYVRDHYLGSYLEPHKIGTYLIQKEQRESQAAYDERKALADPQLHFAALIESLVGMLSRNNGSELRTSGERPGPLGSSDNIASPFTELMRNADGLGSAWPSYWQRIAVNLVLYQKQWLMVDGRPLGEDGAPQGHGKLRLLDYSQVVNWLEDDSGLKEVIIKKVVDARSSLSEERDHRTRYYHYTLEGVNEYEYNANGQTIDRGFTPYAYYSGPDQSQRVLPVYYAELPLDRHIAYNLARKHNSLFNAKSVRDFAMRNMSFSLLQLAASDNEYEDTITALSNGTNVLQVSPDGGRDHKFISPDGGHLPEYSKALDSDVRAFYQNGFREYGDSAITKTATEIRQDARAGVEAFLTLLADALDEAENNAFMLLEQVYDTQSPASWGAARVQRDKDFTPFSTDELADKLINRYFTTTSLSMPEEFLVQALQKLAAAEGIQISKQQAQQHIQALQERMSAQQDLMANMGL